MGLPFIAPTLLACRSAPCKSACALPPCASPPCSCSSAILHAGLPCCATCRPALPSTSISPLICQLIGDKWTCKLDGRERHGCFPSERLHSLEVPAFDKQCQPSRPWCVEEAVALEDIPGYVHAYCSKADKQARLIGQHPSFALWADGLTGHGTMDSLSDCDEQGLRYLPRSAWSRRS